jgi:hypothetical protein
MRILLLCSESLLENWSLLVYLLGVFDQPFKQWLWRVAEVVAKCTEVELGVRPEGRRPAFWWEDGIVSSVFADQISSMYRTHQARTVFSVLETVALPPSDIGRSSLNHSAETHSSTDL